MSILEWMGESVNPGPVGGVEFGGDDERPPEAGGTWLRLAIALALLGGGLGATAYYTDPSWKHVLGGLSAYLMIAWLIRPRADTRNLGWAGGLIDDPFRMSDDWNRGLLTLSILLWPGRFVTDAIWDTLRLLTGFGVRQHAPGRDPRFSPGGIERGPLARSPARQPIWHEED